MLQHVTPLGGVYTIYRGLDAGSAVSITPGAAISQGAAVGTAGPAGLCSSNWCSTCSTWEQRSRRWRRRRGGPCWSAVGPDPSALLGLSAGSLTAARAGAENTLRRRRAAISSSLSVSYRRAAEDRPRRGSLIDESGRATWTGQQRGPCRPLQPAGRRRIDSPDGGAQHKHAVSPRQDRRVGASGLTARSPGRPQRLLFRELGQRGERLRLAYRPHLPAGAISSRSRSPTMATPRPASRSAPKIQAPAAGAARPGAGRHMPDPYRGPHPEIWRPGRGGLCRRIWSVISRLESGGGRPAAFFCEPSSPARGRSAAANVAFARLRQRSGGGRRLHRR